MNKFKAVAIILTAAALAAPASSEGFGMPPEHRCAAEIWNAELMQRRWNGTLHAKIAAGKWQYIGRKAEAQETAAKFVRVLIPFAWMAEAFNAMRISPAKLQKSRRAVLECRMREAGH